MSDTETETDLDVLLPFARAIELLSSASAELVQARDDYRELQAIAKLEHVTDQDVDVRIELNGVVIDLTAADVGGDLIANAVQDGLKGIYVAMQENVRLAHRAVVSLVEHFDNAELEQTKLLLESVAEADDE